MSRLNSDTKNAPSGRLRLEYLDGLRGLAALYVVIYHATTGYRGDELPPSLVVALKFLTYGHFSVAIFIVLSGYCLFIPIVRSPDERLPGGFRGYIRRRARRILPPYYAAASFSLLLIATLPVLAQPTGTMWDGTTPAFTPGALLSHLFLVHNLSENWIFRINGPLWSVAAEWQIYFFLPLMMLPVWRRAGVVVMVLLSFAIGLFPHFVLRGSLEKTYPWYLGLFALGGAAAIVNFSSKRETSVYRENVPWGLLTAVLWIGTALVGFGMARWWWGHLWFADTVVGLATATLLIYCTLACSRDEEKGRPAVLRLLESRGPLIAGRFSYSLYLTHMPVLAVVYIASRALPGGLVRFLVTQATMLPATLVAAYLFHLAFERPFMSAHDPYSRAIARGEPRAAPASALDDRQ